MLTRRTTSLAVRTLLNSRAKGPNWRSNYYLRAALTLSLTHVTCSSRITATNGNMGRGGGQIVNTRTGNQNTLGYPENNSLIMILTEHWKCFYRAVSRVGGLSETHHHRLGQAYKRGKGGSGREDERRGRGRGTGQTGKTFAHGGNSNCGILINGSKSFDTSYFGKKSFVDLNKHTQYEHSHTHTHTLVL